MKRSKDRWNCPHCNCLKINRRIRRLDEEQEEIREEIRQSTRAIQELEEFLREVR